MPEPTCYTLDPGTQGSTLDAYTVLDWLLVDVRNVAAILQAYRDAMEQEAKQTQVGE